MNTKQTAPTLLASLLAVFMLTAAVQANHAGNKVVDWTSRGLVARVNPSRSAHTAQPVDRPENDLRTLYWFSGVADDGEQGSPERKIATAVHCTNVDPATPVEVEVQVFQWDGITGYTSALTAPPGQTITISSQNTTIYMEDALLGGGSGTLRIDQGYGRVLTSRDSILCTAQLLDPLNNPPTTAARLPVYTLSNGCADIKLPSGVGIEDIQWISGHWGLRFGEVGWDGRLDLNYDGLVDVGDIILAALSWNSHC